MLKAIVAVAILFLGSGYINTYDNADAEPGVRPLMGLRCEVTQTARFPRAQWRWFNRSHVEPPRYKATVELEKGTILRVVHFERIHDQFIGCVSVLAEAENGPQKGVRVMIGQVEPWQERIYYGDIWLSNEREGLSAETGRLLRPIDPIPWRNVKMIHEEESRPGPTLSEVQIRGALNRQERN